MSPGSLAVLYLTSGCCYGHGESNDPTHKAVMSIQPCKRYLICVKVFRERSGPGSKQKCQRTIIREARGRVEGEEQKGEMQQLASSVP